jgi:hypothetical protein
MCTDGTSTTFEAGASPQNFEFGKMKRELDSNGKPLQMDACTYEIKAKDFAFTSGLITVRFNLMTEVDVYLNAGVD